MGAIGVESIKGAGQSKRMNWLTATTLVVGIGGLIALLPFGLLGVGLAVSLEGLATGLLSLALARKLAGVSVGELARVLVPPAVAAVVAAVPVALLEYTVAHSETRPIVIGLLFLAGEGLLLLLVFVGVMAVLDPKGVRELRTALMRRMSRDGAAEGATAGAAEDDDVSLLDAPTEWIPVFQLDEPTERVLTSSYRRPAMAGAAARSAPGVAAPPPAPPGPPPPMPTFPPGGSARPGPPVPANGRVRSPLDAPPRPSPRRPPTRQTIRSTPGELSDLSQ